MVNSAALCCVPGIIDCRLVPCRGLWRGNVFFRDYGHFGFPLTFYFRESFWRGEVPLWNPFNNCGLPFLAQWNTQVLYPFSLFYLLFPLPWSLGVFCLLHLFWAGLGMYHLAHFHTGSRLSAAIAGVVFSFNGLISASIMWPNYLSSLAWMPWLVLAAEMAWREGGRRILLAASAGTMQMLSGTPEVIILTWCALTAFWFVEIAHREISRVRLFARFWLLIGLIGALSAGQLLPFSDLLAHSNRDKDFGTSIQAMPPMGWANYVVPLFDLKVVAYGPRVQLGQRYFSSYYLGIGTMAFALLAGWRIRSLTVWVLSVLAALSILLAMGDHGLVYPTLKQIVPQIGFMRYPIKFVILTTFVIPLLAAYGLAWMRSLPEERWRLERAAIMNTGLLLLGLIAGIAWHAWKHVVPGDDVRLTLRNAIERTVFLFVILGCGWQLRNTTDFRKKALLGIALIMLFSMDIITHAPNLILTTNSHVYESDRYQSRFTGSEQFQPLQARVMQTGASRRAVNNQWSNSPEDDFTFRRTTMFYNLNLLDHVAKVDGFFALYLREMNELGVHLDRITNRTSPLLNFLGVSHLSSREEPTNWVRRDTFMPLISAGQQPIYADQSTAFRAVTAPNFAPRQVVYLPLDAQSKLAASDSSNATILSSQLTARQVAAEVEADASAMVVVAQAFYHRWKAFVDGNPVRLWRANYAFQAVEVPAGRHRVTLVYQDLPFLVGSVISLVALVGCTIAWVRRKKDTVNTWAEASEVQLEPVRSDSVAQD